MNLKTTKLADLRKLAKKEGVEGYEDMERKELIEALSSPTEKPEAPEEVEAPTPDESKEEVEASPSDEEDIEDPEEDPEEDDGTPEGEGEGKLPEPEEEKEEAPDGTEGGRTPTGSKAEIMKAKLALQEKVTILIPIEKGEKLGTTTSVNLNGYRVNIKKGVYVKVPEQIAKIIMDSNNQTREALEGMNPATNRKTKLDGGEDELN